MCNLITTIIQLVRVQARSLQLEVKDRHLSRLTYFRKKPQQHLPKILEKSAATARNLSVSNYTVNALQMEEFVKDAIAKAVTILMHMKKSV